MQEISFYNKLYIIQDKVLKIIDDLGTDFYLTGGTALGRIYLNHRYSDDLNLFMNNSDKFIFFVENIKNSLFDIYKNNLTIVTTSDSFVRFTIKENDILLMVDFVNDINYKVGSLNYWEKFSKVDNPLNILSNKISALPRFAEKDVADILFLSYHYSFNWEEIIKEAQEKDMWVNAINVSSIINSFPIDKFDEIKWIAHFNKKKFVPDLKVISTEILIGSDNSLYNNKV